MSEAKRDHSAFQRRAAASQAAARSAPYSVPHPTVKLQTLKLELLELAPPWGSVRAQGRDPYNAVGNRAKRNAAKR